MFRAIIADNFPPFGNLALELPEVPNKPDGLGEVHLFTGVNGTGKTRLLSLMAAMLGNPEPLFKRMKGITSPIRFAVSELDKVPPSAEALGYLATAHHSQLASSFWSPIQLNHRNLNFFGLGGSMREWLNDVPAFSYRGSPYISDSEIKTLLTVPQPSRVECLSFDRPIEMSRPLLQAISNLKVQAALEAMNQQSPGGNGGAANLMQALEGALTQITGMDFKFIVETNPTVLLSVIWGSVKLSFDVLPDGLRSIIGWMVHAVVMMDLWLEGENDPRQTEAVFLLDEIENHLHPAWQRRILPAFQHLFPKAKIFVATHSPFVIASMNHGWIHPLTMCPDGKVKIVKPVRASEGESYISVVEDIMGLKEWYDVETEKLLVEFRSKRDRAYSGDLEAQKEARQLGSQIGERSMELDFMMGKELIQMDRQLARNFGRK